MSGRLSDPVGRLRRWHARWHALLPILVAEFTVLLGFGALLPILPLYIVEHGIDVTTLGIITAAWGVSKLVLEPAFGFIADRTARKPMMVVGLILLGVFTMLPLVFTSALALFVLRLFAGGSAAAYDPPARGIIVDSTTEGERGEAFGLYSAAQMGGFLVGPVLGAVGASLGGGFTFPFLLTGALAIAAGLYLAVALPSGGPARVPAARPDAERGVQAIEVAAAEESRVRPAPLRTLANRLLIATVIMNLGFSLSAGIYEVIWSLFMTSLGASIEFIGVTFALFGLPVLLFSAYAGRLVDRRGGLPYAVGGGLVIAACGVLYSLAWEPVAPAILGLIEGSAFAFTGPALYSLLATSSPRGRTATAQGIFGTSTQLGIVFGAILGGRLWDADHRYPFWFFFVAASLAALVGWLLARRSHRLTRATAVATAALALAVLLAACTAVPPVGPTETPPEASPTASSAPTAEPTEAPTAPPTEPAQPTPTPQRTPFDYVIQTGDSLEGIAARFGVSVAQILAANPDITDPDAIQAGQVIVIPPPDAPVTAPFADGITDPSGDLVDAADQPAFAPGFVDIIELEARVDASTLFIELIMVGAPPPANPEIEQLTYDVFVDTDEDGAADFQLRASNAFDPTADYGATITDLATGASSHPADFPGIFTFEGTIRFEVERVALGPGRTYGVAATVERRFFPGGVGDPEFEAAIDRLPEQAWPRVNARWLTVGL